MVTLIVYNKKGKRGVFCTQKVDNHAEASKLVRGIFAGYKCKILDKAERSNFGNMKSYCDVMQQRGGY